MPGILYGVGVGPGDPELMTLKAVRLLRGTEVIALPGKIPEETVAYRIAVQAVPELAEKKLLAVYMPMTENREELEKCHLAGARRIEEILKKGKNVAFLTLGDPTVYSSFSYIQHIAERDGFSIRLISGVPSFCAAAALLKTSLAERNEPIHIIPAAGRADLKPDQQGTYVLMKAGSRIHEIKEQLKKTGRRICMAENCGMPDETLYHGAEELPDEAGYYSLVIVKENV